MPKEEMCTFRSMYFNGRFVVNLAQFAEQLGVESNQLIALTQCSISELQAEECRLDAEIYNRFIEEAVRLSEDELFGLHAGENMNLAAAGLIAQIAHSSSTVKQALDYCCEFANLGCNALPTRLEEDQDYFKLVLEPNSLWQQQSAESVLHTVYGYLAFSVREFQSLTNSKKYPIEVWMKSQPPNNIEELQRVLGCSVQFNKAEFAILFRKEDINQEVRTSDYALLKVLVDHAYQKLANLHKGKGFYETVRRSVVNLVRPEFPTIEEIAAHLNMSVRTFQRKLKNEGYSYKDIVDELRREFAFGYLKKPELTISEIAYLLSYSDASAFIRTFKRWTGKTPVQWRMEN